MRLLHFSDVHVQEPVVGGMPVSELFGKRLLAAGNLWLTRGRLFREVAVKLEALAVFARDESVDATLCTGDYTALGSEAEYIAARRAVQPLVDSSPLGYCTVPGNHDLYLSDTLRHTRFERHFGDVLGSDLPEFTVDGAFPFVRFVGDELAVIGVNSAKPNPSPFSSAGHVPEAQLGALQRILNHPRVHGRWVFVMTHYGILRPDGRPDSPHHGLANAAALLRICARPRTALLHGHIHHRFAHPPTSERPWLLCSGSATQRGREGIWVYEFEGARVRAIPGYWDRESYKLEHQRSVNLSDQGA
jgi:3',5'-cyclic AMP phosphodiesterase CpdA